MIAGHGLWDREPWAFDTAEPCCEWVGISVRRSSAMGGNPVLVVDTHGNDYSFESDATVAAHVDLLPALLATLDLPAGNMD